MFTALKENAKPLLLLYLSWGLLFFIYWQYLFYFNVSGDLRAGWRIIWADWALHLAQAHAFAHQPFLHVLSNSPIYAGNTIGYPFATNWLSGLLMRWGFDIVNAFVLPSMVFTFALLYALYAFGKCVTQNAAAALIGISLFLLSGGLEFGYYFRDLWNDFGVDKIFYPPHHYTFLEEHGFYWKSVILSSLIPQRALLAGMPWMLLCLTALLQHYQNGFKNTSFSKLFLLGLLTGFLAIIHSHSLLVMFLICACLFARDIKNIRYWFCFGVGVACTALPWFPILFGSHSAAFLQFFPGWYANAAEKDQFVIWFWLHNWGFFLPVALLGLLLVFSPYAEKIGLRRIQLGKLNTLYVAFGLLFLLANLFKFQPFLWDNTKLLIWVYLGFSFLAAQVLLQLWEKAWLGKCSCVVLLVLMCLSGAVDFSKSLHTHRESHTMVSAQQIAFARQFRALSKPTDTVLTPDNHLHYITTMSGRGVLMGYRGWLWTYNIHYQQREQDIRRIYAGEVDAKALIDKHKIDYVVIDHMAVHDYKANQLFFDQNFTRLLMSPVGAIYKVR